MLISDLLKHKGSSVVTIGAAAAISELLASLAEHRVGALVVVDGDRVEGIVSERDVVRGLHRHGADTLTMTVADLMSAPVAHSSPEDPVERIAELMTEGRFRHMPVMQDGALVGIVTLGDVVAARIRQLEKDRGQLEQYISQGA
jgi:CBS domain-containing protein